MAESKANEEKSKREIEEIKNGEEDLDTLLDSALDDFTTLEKPKTAANRAETSTEDKSEPSGSDESKEEGTGKLWADKIKQVLDNDPSIRGMFQQGSSEERKFVQDFSRIAEAASKVIEGESPPSNFTDIISEILKNLNEASESVQNQFGSPDELVNMFQELGVNGLDPLAGAYAVMSNLPPFMQSIMSFLSKEILYPEVKEFVDRYPPWLDEHKATLPAEQYDNYCKQLVIMKRLVAEFEAESESDSEDVKRQKFQKIMDNMQQMQSLGQPPAELICGDGDSPFDESAMPPLPPGMDPT